jgi:hypothetical protein
LANLDDLADLLKSRGCDSLWYFHSDHFEPWSVNIEDDSAFAVERMAAMARTSPFAGKLSLFYCPFIPYRVEGADNPKLEGARVPGDAIVFGSRSTRQEEMARRVIEPLVSQDQHEIHLHVHHEFWTRNTSNFDNPVSRWTNACSGPAADRERLDLYIRLCKEVIARETGAPFRRWAFVHGNWALNASDPLICSIDNEMAIIMRHGGYGDFSFPAGRSYCDPKLQTPFTCLPLDLPRAYDDPRSDPRPVGEGTGVMRPDRFFIWNSSVRSAQLSLDYYAAANREQLKSPELILAEWLGKSAVLGGRLLLKTHAHSMSWQYRLADPDTVIPHCYPPVVTLLECLAQVCDRARIALEPVTVSEVMAALRELDGGWEEPAASAIGASEAALSDMIYEMRDPILLPPLRDEPLNTDQSAGPRLPPKRSSEHILAPPFAPDGGAAWVGELPPELHALTDTQEAPTQSLLRLTEDGVPLGPGHTMHRRIREQGSGAHSFWKTAVWFSTSDGSDPNANGRIYRAEAPQILTGRFRPQGERGWVTLLPVEWHALTDADHTGSRSPLQLLEDGKPLGPGHAQHSRIREIGGGAYSFWKTELLFSTPDGSDPNTNGRVYSIAGMPEAAPAPSPARAVPRAQPVSPPTTSSPPAIGNLAEARSVFPLQGSSGVLYEVYGDKHLDNCPVCHSARTMPLWRMPMANLKEPITVFGGYFDQIPTLQVPGTIFCFDLCQDCESLFLNPVPSWGKEGYRVTDHYIRKMQTEEEWRGYEDAYDNIAKWVPPEATVMIDAACGVGQYLEVARRRSTHRWGRMIGLELAEKYVEHMQAQGLEAHVFDVDNDDLTPLVQPNSVDFITFCEAFEHVERPLDALRKLIAALRPGGRLYFTAQRYGTDVQAAVRPEEPIYIGEKLVSEMPQRLGCRIVSNTTSAMRYFIVLEK